MITYKFRIYPSRKQQDLLWKHANLLNRLYNHFLDKKINAYKTSKTSISKLQLQSEIPVLKRTETWTDLKKIHSQVIQQVTDRLDKTYKAFFDRGFGFPNFRGCSKFFGICYPQSGYSLDLKKNNFRTKSYGTIKFIQHQHLTGEIKRVHITTKSGKWYLCITTTAISKNKGNGTIAIDLGLKNLVTTNTGLKIENKNHSAYFDNQIAKLQSVKSKLKKGSNRYKHFKSTINRLYGVKIRKTNDFLHKVSHNLSTTYDTIICENLNSKTMTESNKHGLNKTCRNTSFGKFINYLDYKTQRLVKVAPNYTSQICNSCGKLHDLKLTNRTLNCECGHIEDRDVNAAKNIYCLGQAILTGYKSNCVVGTAKYLQETLSFR